MSSPPSANPVVVLTLAADSADALVADVDAECRALPSASPINWVRWPLLETHLVDAPSMRPVLASLERYRWVVLPSPTAIVALARRLRQEGLPWPAGARAAVIGPGSVATFHRTFGPAIVAHAPGPPHDADHLIAALVAEEPRLSSMRALVVKRVDAASTWIPRLAGRLQSVDVLPLFQADPIELPASAAAQLEAWLKTGRSLQWVCGTVDQVDTLARWLRANDVSRDGLRRPLWVPHPRIAARARNAGFARVDAFDSRAHLARGLQSIDESPTQEPAPLANEPSPAPNAPSSVSPSGAEPSRVDRAVTEAGPGADTPRPGSGGDSQTPVSPAAAATGRARPWWPLLLLIVIVGLSIAGWWLVQQRFLQVERDSARRIQDAEVRAARLEQSFKSLQDAQAQMAARSAQLESRIARSADQQGQLQALYDELAKTRGDTTFAEIEQAVLTASQNLQLNGNVAAALMSLQMAERRMGTEDGGEHIGIRRLLAQDIERLKGLPAVDLGGVAGRLDEIIARVDRLALLSAAADQAPGVGKGQSAVGPMTTPATGSDAPPASSASPAAAPASVSPPATAPAASAAPAGTPPPGPSAAPTSAMDSLWVTLRRWWAGLLGVVTETAGTVREEFRGLVTIRRIDRPEGLLLSPEQRSVVRENLRMLLLNARLNLLNREEKLFQQDIGRAIQAIERWFDTGSQGVVATVTTLKALQNEPLTLKVPDMSETLSAIRGVRAAAEGRR